MQAVSRNMQKSLDNHHQRKGGHSTACRQRNKHIAVETSCISSSGLDVTLFRSEVWHWIGHLAINSLYQ